MNIGNLLPLFGEPEFAWVAKERGGKEDEKKWRGFVREQNEVGVESFVVKLSPENCELRNSALLLF